MSKIEAIHLKDYKKPAFNIESVELVFELYEEYTELTNVMKICRVDEGERNLLLDSVDLELLSISIDAKELEQSAYSYENEKLTLYSVPNAFFLQIKNRLYPHKNTELEGLYKSGNIFCTQNEPEGFRSITPYLDRPDVMSVFTTTIIADKEKYPILLSNGNKQQCHDINATRHGVTWIDPHKKPSYLFALVAGDLGSIGGEITTSSGKSVELNIYCDKGNESKCFHALESLKKAIVWDEQKYGREYDLDIYNIVAVDSFNMGAMENKGLNIFNSAYVLADIDTASDANFMGIESVIAHEYFHNWTGNRITCRDWFQLTLKEGLTVFRDQCFSGDLNSKEVQRIEDVKALRERQFVEDASPTRHPIQPKSYISMNNFYTATVYEKGAEVIRMIYTLLGEKNYRKATDLYFETFDAQAVTTEDFLWAMSEASGVDLEQFKLWYHQSGTPTLEVEESFKDGVYTLTLRQNVPQALDGSLQKPLFFPLSIALFNPQGEEILSRVLEISLECESFRFENLDAQPLLSINRDFSAPIYVQRQNADYSFLMKYDTNSFTQYEAAQSFALVSIEDIMQKREMSEAYSLAFGHLLDLDVDLSFKAHLLETPSVSTLMQRQSVVDFELIYEARDNFTLLLAQRYKEKLLALYKEHHFAKDENLDATSMARRSLKNRVLVLLSALESEEIAQLAKTQYEESLSMSDRVVALDVLESIHPLYAEVAFRDFYEKYKSETLVMNKYFSLLASSSRTGTLDRVQALQNDEVYDERVPNLVRSLIGVFARNYKHFHAKDGYGYEFVANKIIEIDKLNAQMASGLAGAFKIYPKMNTQSKERMRVALERVVSTQGLSKNSFEIVSKILK